MNTYHSGFADLIQMFVDNRKAIGMGYERYGYDLHLFDKFCVMNYPPLAPLRQEMVDAWCVKRDTELNRTRNTRIRLSAHIYIISEKAWAFRYQHTGASET